MAQTDKVIRSIENLDGTRCCDLFICPDGSHGFAEYRRDPEDSHGWRPVGAAPETGFPTQSGALSAARRQIAWLEMVLETDH